MTIRFPSAQADRAERPTIDETRLEIEITDHLFPIKSPVAFEDRRRTIYDHWTANQPHTRANGLV
jgi:hypothetical protein